MRVLPITDLQNDYAQKIFNELKVAGIRASIDLSGEKIAAKIRSAETAKVHNMFIVGQKEIESESVSIRVHGKGDQGAKSASEAISSLKNDISGRIL